MVSITQKYLKECMTFDPEKQVFIWNKRPPEHFKDGKKYPKERICASWNGNFAGKEAGSWVIQGYLIFAIDKNRYNELGLIALYFSEDENKVLKKNGHKKNF